MDKAMRRISLDMQVGGYTTPRDIAAQAFGAMLPTSNVAGHPAIVQIIWASQGQPLHPEFRSRLASFGASPSSLDYLNALIVHSRPAPNTEAAP